MTDWRDDAQRQLAQARDLVGGNLVSADYLDRALAELDKADARHAEDQAEIDALRQQLESRTKPWSGDIPNDMLDWCRLHEIDVHPWRRAFHAKLQDLVEMRDKQADARHAADAEAPEVIRRHEYGPTAAQQPPLRGEDGKEPQT